MKSEALMHFNPQLPTTLIVDASPVGLGAMLCQNHQGVLKPISYASRTLTQVERRYCQLERKALAIVWACEKFHLYLYGKEFTIMTDQKALTTIFSLKGKPSARILQWILRMQQYDFTVQHIKGSDNPADILFRQPLPFDAQISEEEKLAEGFINYVVAKGFPKAMTLSEILEESGKDPTIRALEDAIAKNEWTDKLAEPFKHIRAELTSKRGLMLRGSRIIMPQTLQRRTMQPAHETHLGMVKTKALLRGKVWWPTINKDMEKAIRQCIPCASLDTRKQANPVNMSEMKGLWEVIHVDILYVDLSLVVTMYWELSMQDPGGQKPLWSKLSTPIPLRP
ncbi:uncharacterized protein LOC121857718 [Homarus americanus]|uniref:uncharacterized protein LOC121857718 n=1 Tax=Homarus americanus TaxID=6706 RepID=UPI001C43DEF3|nr:uncharacterized protein LOC121857718 [Homarus americanus]